MLTNLRAFDNITVFQYDNSILESPGFELITGEKTYFHIKMIYLLIFQHIWESILTQ